MKARCPWARSEASILYHDREWGVPAHDDRVLFEFLILEGAQAGLSWETILRKRERYRSVLAGFDPAVVARWGAREQRAMLRDPGVVRHPGKIAAAVRNARAFLHVQEEMGSFDRYVWGFVDGRPLTPRRRRPGEVPSRTPVSDSLSRDLRGRGFAFVGPTICYAFMQAVGMVNDHLLGCFRRDEIAG